MVLVVSPALRLIERTGVTVERKLERGTLVERAVYHVTSMAPVGLQ